MLKYKNGMYTPAHSWKDNEMKGSSKILLLSDAMQLEFSAGHATAMNV